MKKRGISRAFLKTVEEKIIKLKALTNSTYTKTFDEFDLIVQEIQTGYTQDFLTSGVPLPKDDKNGQINNPSFGSDIDESLHFSEDRVSLDEMDKLRKVQVTIIDKVKVELEDLKSINCERIIERKKYAKITKQLNELKGTTTEAILKLDEFQLLYQEKAYQSEQLKQKVNQLEQLRLASQKHKSMLSCNCSVI